MFLQNALLIIFFAAAMFPAKACSSASLNNSNARVAVSPTLTASPDAGEAKGEREKMDVLTQKVIAKDPSAILLAKQIGSSAATSLKPLAKNEDPIVREIALRCLEQSGGEDVAQVFAEALLDESSSVKIAALAGLNTHLTPSVYNQLLQAFDQLDNFPIEYAEYINQPWAARALVPVLLDKSEMLRIGVDGLPGAVPEYLRACDLAVNAIAKITGATFSFPVNGRTNYTDEQLTEVRQFIVR